MEEAWFYQVIPTIYLWEMKQSMFSVVLQSCFLILVLISVACRSQDHASPGLEVAWLKKIRPTTRISSNTYADFVVDGKGHTYTACFYTGADREDYLYIVKTDGAGKIRWELDEIKGRACGIALDQEGHLWVTGFFRERISTGDCVQESSTGIQPFLLRLDPEGNCLNLVAGKGHGSGFHCHVNQRGTVLVQGTAGSELEFGGRTLYRDANGGEGFIAAFDLDGQCRWIRQMGGFVNSISDDAAGNFYLAGAFHTSFSYDSLQLTTTGPFDQDAFLLKVDEWGNNSWVRKFGDPGIVKNGYRTNEMGCDLNRGDSGEILLALRTEGFPQINPKHLGYEPESRISVVALDTSGNTLSKRTLVKSTLSDAIMTFRRAKQSYYLATIFPANCTITNAGFELPKDVLGIVRFDLNWEVRDTIFSTLDPGEGNALLRVSKSAGDAVYYSGHFRESVDFGPMRLNNGGAHELFLLKLE